MANKRLEVLVVDDSLNQQEAAERQFSKEDAQKKYNLHLAQDYQTATRMIRKDHYDALLTDLFFPFGSDEEGKTYPITEEEARKPEPLGHALALEGLANGIRKIAVVSMENHHNGALAASYERLENFKYPLRKMSDNLYVGATNEYPSHPNDKNWLKLLEIMLENKESGGKEDGKNN